MLAGAGFGDDALLVHTTREQHLPDRIVDFVCACVKQILALEIDGCASTVFSQTGGVKERRRPAGVVLQKILEFRLKRLIVATGEISRS
jgi:hypothetical protein